MNVYIGTSGEVKSIYLGEGTTTVLSDMQGPCEDGFHVPLSSEWQAIVDAGVSLGAWTTGSNGHINFSTYLKIPLAGFIEGDTSNYEYKDSIGNYWSSTSISSGEGAYYLLFRSLFIRPQESTFDTYGMSIRGLKNTPVIPDSSWATLYQGTGSAGIFYKSDLGLISISSDGSTWYTIQDKNLGATTTYNYGDTLSESNCGYYYQWGNNNGFPFNGTLTTSTTQINANTYGPGNYYESSTFVKRNNSPYCWDSSKNKNKWGGVSQGTSTKVNPGIKAVYLGGPVEVNDYSAMKGPAPAGFHIPLSTEWQAIYDVGVSLGAWTSSGCTNLVTYLKLPMSGGRSYNSSASAAGSMGFYWSSSKRNDKYAYCIVFYGSEIYPNTDYNISQGQTIRCFKDTPTEPTSDWTVLYQGAGSAGIYHDSTNGLISISSDGTTWYTIMDKNLGATTVYNYGDTLSVSNTGNVFQWGNNYAFPGALSSASITTSSSTVNASTYGPGNYYSSSTWVTPMPWESSNNTNLRGGETGVVQKTVYQEVKNIYIGEYKPPRTFTISWTEKSDMSSGWTYSDDATGLTAGSGDFDDFFGYSAVLLGTDGTENSEMKQTGGVFSDTMTNFIGNSTDNVMIKFPLMGIKMSKSGSNVTLSLTQEENKDGYQYYAFNRNGVTKDKLYLGSYQGSKYGSYLKSWSGQTDSGGNNNDGIGYISISDAAVKAKANGTGYEIETYYARMFINALYMMKYGNPNSRSTVGWGKAYVYGSLGDSGQTDSITSATGAVDGTEYYGRIKLFGLEDWWGNGHEYLDGAYFTSSTTVKTSKTGAFNSSGVMTTFDTSISGLTGWNVISAIIGTNEGLFACKSVTAGVQYYCSVWNTSSSRYLAAGGGTTDYSNRAYRQILSMDCPNGVAVFNSTSRLMYL